MPTSTLTSKGQITVPKEIRTLLKLEKGQELDFQVRAGSVILRPKNRDVRQLRGLLARKGAKRASVRQMNDSIVEGYADA